MKRVSSVFAKGARRAGSKGKFGLRKRGGAFGWSASGRVVSGVRSGVCGSRGFSGGVKQSGSEPAAEVTAPVNGWSDADIGTGKPERRAYTYFMLGSARFLYASAARLAVLKFVSSMSASADVLALSTVEMDLSGIDEGSTITIKWRGKPVFIRHRTAAEIAESEAVDVSELRDPEQDSERVKNPKWLIALGVCTHLGCVPISNAGNYNGWFCPCHGSHYDTSGRIRKGPAPLNLEVPEYKFMDENTVLIG